MMTALLQTLKHTPEEDLTNLLGLVRDTSQPDVLAERLHEQFTTLQTKGFLPKFAFDTSDVISFAQQGLCDHETGRLRPGSSATEDPSGFSSPNLGKSSAAEAEIADHEFINDEVQIQDENLVDEQLPHINETNIHPNGLSSAEMFHLAIRVPPSYDNLNALYQHHDKSFNTPSQLGDIPTAAADRSFAPYNDCLWPYSDFPLVTPHCVNPVLLDHQTQKYMCNPSYPGLIPINSPMRYHTFHDIGMDS